MWKWIAVAVAIVAFALFSMRSRFVQADLDNMKSSIKAEYEKREDVVVEQIELLSKSDTEVVGFVKFRIGQLPSTTHTCSATLDKNSSKYIWRCNP